MKSFRPADGDRNGLVVGATVTQATGTAEREAALAMIDALKPKGRITLGADKANAVGFDTRCHRFDALGTRPDRYNRHAMVPPDPDGQALLHAA